MIYLREMNTSEEQLPIPGHIGFIMDGNRRYALGNGLARQLGHKAGADNIENVLGMCQREGIEQVSMWALSKSNLENRSKAELAYIFNLIRQMIPRLLPKLIEKRIRFDTIGDPLLLPEDVRRILADAHEATSRTPTEMIFILAVGYGGEDEIVRGIRRYIRENVSEIVEGRLDELLSRLDEKSFRQYIDTGKYKDPDLIIRTSGEERTSGYFAFTGPFAEWRIIKKHWPEFDESDFRDAIRSFQRRKRNFGK